MNDGLRASIIEKAKAGYPAIYLHTPEYVRAEVEIIAAAEATKRECYIWTFDSGLYLHTAAGRGRRIEETATPPEVLAYIKSMKGKAIILLRFFHHYLEDHNVQAKILELIPQLKLTSQMLVALCQVQRLPPELEKEFTLIESKPPGKETLDKVLDGIISVSRMPEDKRPSPELRKQLVEAATGLTTAEAENAFSLASVRPRLLNNGLSWDVRVVTEEKCNTLKKTGLLEYIPTEGIGLQQVGGMQALKDWVRLRRRSFTEEARAFGLPHPKGMLMLGPPGSGKSLGAKAVSAELKLPLIRCDMGKLFGSLVGQSEANLRMAINTAEAMSPCVLWIDEIEKGLAGSSSNLDSGVGARLLGHLLTWMQEKKTPVFVYATANDVLGLPPELLRKGRFDEMFSVLLPDEEDRKEILNIHLQRINRAHLVGVRPLIDINHLAKETAGFSGAEIEAAIDEALHIAFDARETEGGTRDLTGRDLQTAVDSIQPLSKTMKERIEALEAWCLKRTRSASGRKTSVREILAFGMGRAVDC